MASFSRLNTGQPDQGDLVLSSVDLIASRIDNCEDRLMGSKSLDSVDINGGTVDGVVIGAAAAGAGTFTSVDSDNIKIDGNTISSTDTNGDINLTPNGTGRVVASGVALDSKLLSLYGYSTTDYNSSGDVTLYGEAWYRNFTLNVGHTLYAGSNPTNFLILRVNGTLTIAGNISGVGRGGNGDTGSGVAEGGVLGGGTGGGGDDYGGAGLYYDQSLKFVSSATVLVAGVAAETAGRSPGDSGYATTLSYVNRLFHPGCGGGGGSRTGRIAGSGGSGLLIYARNLVITGTPTISCRGQHYSETGNGIGCGGGGGGVITIVYETLTGSLPTLDVAGGNGDIGSGGKNGGAGSSFSYKLGT